MNLQIVRLSPGARRHGVIKNQSGMALALVIVVMALLTIIVFDRLRESWIETAIAASYGNETKAFFAARSGQAAGRMILAEDAKRSPGYDALTEEWAYPSIPIPIDDEYVFVSIGDEGGKLNLNSLTSSRGYPQKRTIAIFRRLLTNLEIDPDLADGVVDWIDPNDNLMPSGAESAHYLSLKNPYQAKNQKFDSVDELALVKGFEPEVMNILKPHITVWSNGKININTATPAVLLSLDEAMTEELAKTVSLYRSQRPVRKINDIKKIPGMADLYPALALVIDTKSDHFSVMSTATFDETTRSILAIYKRPSPLLTTVYYKVL